MLGRAHSSLSRIGSHLVDALPVRLLIIPTANIILRFFSNTPPAMTAPITIDGGGDRDDFGIEERDNFNLLRLNRLYQEDYTILTRRTFSFLLLGPHEFPNIINPEEDITNMAYTIKATRFKPNVSCIELDILIANGFRVNPNYYSALCPEEETAVAEARRGVDLGEAFRRYHEFEHKLFNAAFPDGIQAIPFHLREERMVEVMNQGTVIPTITVEEFDLLRDINLEVDLRVRKALSRARASESSTTSEDHLEETSITSPDDHQETPSPAGDIYDDFERA